MNKSFLILILTIMKYSRNESIKNLTGKIIFSALLFIFTCCENENITDSRYIEGLSIENYPVIDGSTSTLPLNTVVACELLGLGYQWKENKIDFSSSSWSMEPKVKHNTRKKLDRVVKSSQTHNSYINLIDGDVDIALTARTMSPDEKSYAESKGITLIETPIAIDAFIFIINPHNDINELTTEDIQNIYTGKVTDWRDLGLSLAPSYDGPLPITPFIRNPNSGSQELMDLLVMKDLDYYTKLPIYEEALVFTMAGLLDNIANHQLAIGYTVYYYNEHIVRGGNRLKTIGIDGIHPNKQTISDRSYPYASDVYAVIRSDTDMSSMAYRIYEWLQTEAGKQAISKSGYIPN